MHLLNKMEYGKILNLAKEVDEAYQQVQEAISHNQQCEDSFHRLSTIAILKSQQFQTEVYNLANTKFPYEMAVLYQGFILLLMVAASYLLLVQYLFRTKDYDNILWKPKFIRDYLPFVALVLLI